MTRYPSSGEITECRRKIKIAANFNEHARHATEMGMDVGSPDLLLSTREGNVLYLFYIELKTKKGKLSQAQINWHKDYLENFSASNTHYAVAYGYEHAVNLVDAWIHDVACSDS